MDTRVALLGVKVCTGSPGEYIFTGIVGVECALLIWLWTTHRAASLPYSSTEGLFTKMGCSTAPDGRSFVSTL
jgi:hypothetical protein